MIKTEKVLIVGGGFAGVKTALELADSPNYKVSLLTDDDELRYYPTLYHTATGSKRANSSIPLTTIFGDRKITILKGRAKTLDRQTKSIVTEANEVHEYDILVLALGVVTNYFGIPGLADYSYSIKTQAEVARFKAHLHQQLVKEHKPDLNYVIAGGGPTGIELAGALPSYLSLIMRNHNITQKKVHITLVEASPRLLQRMPKKTSRLVKKQLKKLGIKLILDARVEGETADELMVSGKPLKSHTVVWTAGVTNNPFFKDNGFVITGRGKVAVDTYLQAEDNIFVLGDNANTPFSGLAQTALLDAGCVANNLKRRAAGKSLKSYNAKEPITVVPAGPHWAVVSWRKITFQGWLGFMLREAADLIGFHDLEPWPEATRQFLTEFGVEHNCSICAEE